MSAMLEVSLLEKIGWVSNLHQERTALRHRQTLSRHACALKSTKPGNSWRSRLVVSALPHQNNGFFDVRVDAADYKSRDRMACRSLPTADYTFYQKMREQDVTEIFLWDQRLAPLLGYLPPEQVAKVREALSLAYDAHSGQMRKSGEPFITHPVEVTRILAELQMDYESLVAGLLHDTVEDCGELVGLEEIGFHFGSAVMRIVEGETKFSKLPTHHPERRSFDTSSPDASNGAQPPTSGMAELAAALQSSGDQASGDAKAQDLQFLFLAMTEEVRIIVVKLADRLHNMRTMASMPPGKQRRIAQETLSVFAPLARLLGLYSIKEELEELSFKYALPQQYAVMQKTVDKLWEQQKYAVAAAAEELRKRLIDDFYLRGHVVGIRVGYGKRSLYGIWRKLQDSGRSVRDVSEIAQLRVILQPVNGSQTPLDYSTDKQLCYHVMGLIHAFWAPIPGSMKDYIATPKPNNYQSLHTTVVPTGLRSTSVDGNGNGNGNGNGRSRPHNVSLFPIEIQIRTEEMDRLAEYGIAVESWSCADYSRGSAQNEKIRLGSDDDQPMNGSSKSNGNGNGNSLVNGVLRHLPGFTDMPSDTEDDESVLNSWDDDDYGSSPNGNGIARNSDKLDPRTMSRRINWLNSIRQWQQEFVGTLTATEFVQCITDDILGQGVFVFTPSGQVMRLPKSATVVDFAYHIHTDVGNTMVAAKVNGKVVNASHELQNAEVVEVITYKGPINGTIYKRHQQWLEAAHTKTARHKIAKFLREHAAIAAAKGLVIPEGSGLGIKPADAGADGTPQTTWLIIRCTDRQGLLAEISNIIARHEHNITTYSGSSDRGTGQFIMEYELEGDPARIKEMCDDLSCVESVDSWAIGCTLEDAQLPKRGR